MTSTLTIPEAIAAIPLAAVGCNQLLTRSTYREMEPYGRSSQILKVCDVLYRDGLGDAP
ncbi:hypothetical protein KBY71_02235 [Cyanobium sp. T1B-Tous]|uniref:hypothetical protein n=1 Tax=Cyanobium sp. T1B-Tous TaxID=2823721 RepID=UPI0020CE88FF|nr:hypothetical protein [Cyanobium sp. T1B-Tous]MCP9805339.1 hypothetical protein [Cyanobium sp. T1B-Tous]